LQIEKQDTDGEGQKPDVLYPDIIKGYSFFNIGGICKPFYFAHFTHVTQQESRNIYLDELEKIKKRGVKTEQQFINSAIKNKWWSKKNEDSIREKRDFIRSLRENSARAFLVAQKKAIDDEIKNESGELAKLLDERAGLVSSCAESIAMKKSEDYILLNCVYSDKDLSKKLFEDFDLDDFSENEATAYSSSIWSVNLKFSDEKIKRLAASSFFQGLVRICPDDSAHSFYGKSVSELTVFQSSLFTYGNFYKKCIKNSTEKIPDHVFSDPESLISWCEGLSNSSRIKKNLDRNPNAKKTKGERSGRISSIVGATTEDYKNLGLVDDSPKIKQKGLIEMAREQGGALGIIDAVKATDSKITKQSPRG